MTPDIGALFIAYTAAGLTPAQAVNCLRTWLPGGSRASDGISNDVALADPVSVGPAFDLSLGFRGYADCQRLALEARREARTSGLGFGHGGDGTGET